MELAIKKLGNSTGLILPPALLRSLNVSVGNTLTAEQIKGKLILTPTTKHRYSLSELLAQCNSKAPVPDDVKAWDSIQPVGKEII